MGHELSDKDLVIKFRNGMDNAFEELMGRYTTKAFGLALRLTRSREDAEEVLQDVFVTVYKKIDGFEEKSSFSSWLYRITVNTALMKLRKRRQAQRTSLTDDLSPGERDSVINAKDEKAIPLDEASAQKELMKVLSDAISRLPEEYRPVFVLRDVDGLSTRQVGKMLNLTAPAVKSRLHRSRMILRKRLQTVYKEYTTQASEKTRQAA